jgi:hypothetical protein
MTVAENNNNDSTIRRPPSPVQFAMASNVDYDHGGEGSNMICVDTPAQMGGGGGVCWATAALAVLVSCCCLVIPLQKGKER